MSDLITSASNPRIKFAAGLRDSKDRKRENLFVIDGLENILLALEHGVEIREVFVCETAWQTPTAKLEQLLSTRTLRWTRVSQAPMEKLQYGQQNAQAIAIAVPPKTTLESLSKWVSTSRTQSDRELYLVLDRIEKPGNLGAAMRTADAAGVTAVLLSDPASEVWNPNAIRASLGAIFTVPLAIDTWMNVSSWLSQRQATIYAARTESGQTYSHVQYPRKLAVVIGSEAQGLQDRWQTQNIFSVHIPMFGRLDSLNASVTGSILLFEVIRQWQAT